MRTEIELRDVINITIDDLRTDKGDWGKAGHRDMDSASRIRIDSDLDRVCLILVGRQTAHEHIRRNALDLRRDEYCRDVQTDIDGTARRDTRPISERELLLGTLVRGGSDNGIPDAEFILGCGNRCRLEDYDPFHIDGTVGYIIARDCYDRIYRKITGQTLRGQNIVGIEQLYRSCGIFALYDSLSRYIDYAHISLFEIGHTAYRSLRIAVIFQIRTAP